MGKIRAQVAALLTVRERIARGDQRWIVGISGPGTIVRNVEIPPMPRRELRKAVLWQAQKKIPFPLDEAHVAVHYLKRKPKQPVQAVVAAAIRRMVDDLLYLLTEAEIQPAMITLPAFGLGQLLHHAGHRRAGEYYGLIDVGTERSLFAVYRDSQMEFYREIDCGLAPTQDLQADNAQMSLRHDDVDSERAASVLFQRESAPDADTILREEIAHPAGAELDRLLMEVQSTLEYFSAQSAGARMNTCLLLGGGAQIPGIDRHMAQALEIPVQPFDIGLTGQDAPEADAAAPSKAVSWATAYGYSLVPLRAPNLLPREYLAEREAEFRSLLWRTATGTAVAVSLLVTGAEYYRGDHAARRLARIQAQLAETNVQMNALGVAHVEATLAANRMWVASLARLDLNSATLLRAVAALTPARIAVDRIDVRPGDSGWAHVQLSGVVRAVHEQNEVVLADFVEQLRATGWLQEITLQSYNTRRQAQFEQITFSLSMLTPLEAARS
jgi:type IV pilus assembly protein PilM